MKPTVTCWLPLILMLLACSKEKNDSGELDLVGKRTSTANPSNASKSSWPKARVYNTFAVDLIQDLVFRYQRDGWTLTTPRAHVNLDKLRKGGLGFVLSAIPLSPEVTAQRDLDRALSAMDALVTDAGGQLEMVTSFEEAKRVSGEGRIPMGLMMEGADPLIKDPDRLVDLKKRGLALVGLVGGRNNGFADAAVSPRDPGGLTEKGRLFVETCRDAGILVDLTHASPATFWDTLAKLSGRVVVSHTAARALMDHPRNLNDLQMIALSRYGGVMGLIFNPEFLKMSGSASIDDVVEHIMYIKAIGAIDALALGTDYGGIHPPRGLEDVSRLPRLAEALQAQGLSVGEIEGIFGDNVARLFEETSRKYGEVRLTEDEILRPVTAECESVIGEFSGSLPASCDRFVRASGAVIPPASKLKVRIRDMAMTTVQLELFGEPGVPWQAEGQNLEGKILFHRFVKLDDEGKGTMSLPQNRNLTRMFFSPTRASALREVVVWGRPPDPPAPRRTEKRPR